MTGKVNTKKLGMWMLAGGTLFSGCHGTLHLPALRGEFSSAGAFVDFVGGALAVTDDGVFLDLPNGFVEVNGALSWDELTTDNTRSYAFAEGWFGFDPPDGVDVVGDLGEDAEVTPLGE